MIAAPTAGSSGNFDHDPLLLDSDWIRFSDERSWLQSRDAYHRLVSPSQTQGDKIHALVTPTESPYACCYPPLLKDLPHGEVAIGTKPARASCSIAFHFVGGRV